MIEMKIVYLAPIAFDELKQRSQYMAEYLAKHHKVIYVEPTLRWMSHLKNRQIDYSKKYRRINENLSVFRCNGLLVPPFHWNLFDLIGVNGLSEMLQLKKMVYEADIVIAGFEGWYQVLRWLKIPCLIYDKMDDNALLVKNAFDKKYLLKAEKRLLKKAKMVIVTAQIFLERYQRMGKQAVLIPNGVELPNAEIKETKHQKKIYGYVGMISSWIDMDIIEQIADESRAEVWLVGPCNISASKKENVKYIGKVSKDQVAGYINQFDACLYPFKQDLLTDTVNPVKIYEYLAMNKPVIAVDSMETRKFGDLVYRYSSKKDIQKLCNENLKKPFDDEHARLEFIENNSWKKRIERVERLLEQMI